ncbi:Bug family tripartite tricarboxylate transporter substrate binding protein [Amorphus coralli]|uniref:Bug family tripartite tricarboxylate transporter substrate binding protein n=1 Tax=Amorphus coralli TaxID=340680 RepID=UPI000375AF74|nr:tripartite tricarboxylate transporter substrate binding protein [Amorphus coralli]
MVSTVLRSVIAGAAALTLATGATAADWPERPVHVVVAYGAGGGTDTLSRMVAEPLSEVLGQPVVIDNRPGAGGTIGAAAAAKADPDGYTMYMMANGHTVAAAMYKDLPYDAVSDFQPVSVVARMPLVVVARPDFEASTIEELVALAKENPGDLTFASVGVGSSQHFAGALLAETLGVDVVHIPYQKTPEALAAVLSGEVDMLVEVLAPVVGQVKAGDIKALAVTSAERHPALPDVSTVAEAGHPDYDVATWYGLNFPAGTPDEIVEQANAAVQKAVADEDLQKKALESGYVIGGSTPEAFGDQIASDVERWQKVREAAGIEQR